MAKLQRGFIMILSDSLFTKMHSPAYFYFYHLLLIFHFFPGNNFVSSAKLTHQKVFSYNLFSIQDGLLTSMEIVLNKGIAV